MIESPCIGVCKLDKKGKVCTACKRTVEEIMKWSSFNKKDRKKILIDLKKRKSS